MCAGCVPRRLGVRSRTELACRVGTVARPPRLLVPDGIYHVITRGNERRLIYRDPFDQERFLDVLGRSAEGRHWRVLAYCLMSNHYHLLVQTPEPDLAAGMQQLNGSYAQAFNRRHGRVGHLFQGRYGARLVQRDEHLHATVRYVIRNPVRAGLCRSPIDWPWSSHRATLAETESPRFLDADVLLSFYGCDRDSALRHYREEAERPDAPQPDGHPLVFGDDAFVRDALARLGPARGVPRRYVRPSRPALSELLTSTADGRAIAAAHAHGYSLREIGRHLGVNASTVSRRLERHRLRVGSATGGA